MLKRFRCKIDLESNSLKINNVDIPFLPPDEIPHSFSQEFLAPTQGKEGQSTGKAAGKAPASSSQTVAASAPAQPLANRQLPSSTGATAPSLKPAIRPTPAPPTQQQAISEAKIKTLIDMGVARQEAIQALALTNGNIDEAFAICFPM